MRDVQSQAEILNEKILNSFIMAGEEFVKDAREQIQDHAAGTYLDQTTNLRNSIGYFVYHNGVMVKENLIGNAIANKEIAQEFINPKGFQLIGIAGMNYASHVESKGYNVISNQADLCVVNLTGYLKELNIKENG
jgi:hypothetical protein